MKILMFTLACALAVPALAEAQSRAGRCQPIPGDEPRPEDMDAYTINVPAGDPQVDFDLYFNNDEA